MFNIESNGMQFQEGKVKKLLGIESRLVLSTHAE